MTKKMHVAMKGRFVPFFPSFFFFFFFCLEAGYNLGIVENKVRQGVSIYLRLSLI